MLVMAPEGSRDRRIEDPSNLWLIHPLSRSLLPAALSARISANAVSFIGLGLGAGAALAYAQWRVPWMATLGFALTIFWLVADGLDGMVARASGTSSALGRLLDGVCDHLVFIAIYVALALSIGSLQAWVLAIVAGAAHALQANIYETERARFHRRIRGDGGARASASGTGLARRYDALGNMLAGADAAIDRAIRDSRFPAALGAAYGACAAPALRLQALLSANTRVVAIYLACVAGDPRLFWWFEILALTLVMIGGLNWHRRAVAELLRGGSADTSAA